MLVLLLLLLLLFCFLFVVFLLLFFVHAAFYLDLHYFCKLSTILGVSRIQRVKAVESIYQDQCQFSYHQLWCKVYARIKRGGGGGRAGGPDPPPEKSQKTVFLINTGPDPLKNHKDANPEFNVGPFSVRQRNAI